MPRQQAADSLRTAENRFHAIQALQASVDVLHELHASSQSFWQRRTLWRLVEGLEAVRDRLISTTTKEP